MSARFECQDCDFTTGSVQMAETHERRRVDHEVFEIEQPEPVSADDRAFEQAREVEVVARLLAVRLGVDGQPAAERRHLTLTEAERILRALAPLRAAERQEAAREALLAAAEDGNREWLSLKPGGWGSNPADQQTIDFAVKAIQWIRDRADGVTGRSGT